MIAKLYHWFACHLFGWHEFEDEEADYRIRWEEDPTCIYCGTHEDRLEY